MNKALAVAVLLLGVLAIGFATSSPTTGTFAGPRVIATGALTGQTSNIPTTTIFTPPRSGLFRLSAYATLTTPATSGFQSSWAYDFTWTDDAGVATGGTRILIDPQNDQTVGAFNWNEVGPYGTTLLFQAKGGTSVTYDVTQLGTPDGSAYSLYYTIERLE
ncbi:MAG: hypothetical protein WB729_24445 [Candidatus Sulfotelmatobacter sp.]